MYTVKGYHDAKEYVLLEEGNMSEATEVMLVYLQKGYYAFRIEETKGENNDN